MRVYKPLIILLVLPLVILLLAYGVVKLLNTGSRAGQFYVEMEKDIVFPWEDTVVSTVHLDMSQSKGIGKDLENANIVIALDNSDSMEEGKDSRFELAKEAILNFIDNFALSSQARVGVILFSHEVNKEIPLTADIDTLKKSLAAFPGKAGGTDFLSPLELAARWLAGKDATNQKNFIIFLTDGGIKEEDCQAPNRVYKNRLLPNGVDIFMVGVGQGAWLDMLRKVIEDNEGNVPPNRVLTCDDPLRLQSVFDRAAEEMGSAIGRQGEMLIPLADKTFQWREKSIITALDDWKNGRFLEPPPGKQNPFVLNFPNVFARTYIFHMVKQPYVWGIIKPFYRQILFSYIDPAGNPRELSSAKIPHILNITYWFLWLLYLPALLYLVYAILGRKEQEIPAKEVVIIPYEKHQKPGTLPQQWVHDKADVEWIPTLVIGLGRTGRHILTHLKQDVKELLKEDTRAIRFLSIDVAASEVDGPQPDRVPGVVTQLDRQTEIYIPGPGLRNVKDKVDEYKDKAGIVIEDPYTSLNLSDYAALADEVLGLNNGTARNPALARAYLVKELEKGSESQLLNLLEQQLTQLNHQAREAGFMQILLIGNTNGGVGSGMIAHLSVLIRRLAEKIKSKENSVEIDLLLVEDRQDHDDPRRVPIQNSVLLEELNLISQAGRVNFPIHLARKTMTVIHENEPTPKDDGNKQKFLRGGSGGAVFSKSAPPGRRRQEDLLKTRPYNNIYVYAQRTGKPGIDLYPQVADTILFFIERTARRETRHLLESIKKQEGETRKKEKIELYTHIAGRSIIYPAQLIKETLKMLFLEDIFSSRAALTGLVIQEGFPVIKKQGTMDDLFQHPLTVPILKQELGAAPNKWQALLMGQDTGFISRTLAEDTENFWGFLEKAMSLLLSEGVFSLTGLLGVIDEMQNTLRPAQAAVAASTEASEIEKTVTFLEALGANIQAWHQVLLGTKETKGLLEIIQTRMKELEIVKDQLLEMNKSRIVLGIHKNTPGPYHIDTLRKKWLARWLTVEDEHQVYPELKKRFNWKIVEEGVFKPGLLFEFTGTTTYTFPLHPDFQKDFINQANQIAEQFLVNLKDITILEILMEHEKENSLLYNREQITKELHQGVQGTNLSYIYLLPHASRIRLTRDEDHYLEKLKENFKEIKPVEEVFFYPPSSNQYRLFSLQVSSLLEGNPKEEPTNFKPVHLTGILKQANQKLIRERFNIQVPGLLPIHYLVFYYPENFKCFVNLWAAGKIFKDELDGLWKVEQNGRVHRLTVLKDEALEDAAVYFVMNLDIIGGENLAPPLTPREDRLEKLNSEANKRSTFYCWMKLYI
jgi:hypothetical protein